MLLSLWIWICVVIKVSGKSSSSSRTLFKCSIHQDNHDLSSSSTDGNFKNLGNEKTESCHCYMDHIEETNEMIFERLNLVLETPFFRYYRINLNSPCPFWKVDHKCGERDCEVRLNAQVPTEITQFDADQVNLRSMSESPDFEEEVVDQLGDIVFMNSGGPDAMFRNTCKFKEDDFCVVDRDLQDDGAYVDLVENPEAFTGYAGPSAHRVWRAIYEENCFHYAPELLNMQSLTPHLNDVCIEKKIFYRILSGLHASISMHLSWKHYNRTTGRWGPNLEEYEKRFSKNQDRVENIYFTYNVVLRAINKLSGHLKEYPFCTGNSTLDLSLKGWIQDLVEITTSCPVSFDEKLVFERDDFSTLRLKKQMKNMFRNISQVMDCVGCEKCRLWGKIQVTGLGTALKILFSEKRLESLNLQRNELVSLFNMFGRLSESVHANLKFQEMQMQSDNHDWLRQIPILSICIIFGLVFLLFFK